MGKQGRTSAQRDKDLAVLASAASPDRRWSQAWLASKSAGVLTGLVGVALITALVYFFDRYVSEIPSPSLSYTLLLLGVAYLWGWEVGTIVAAAASLSLWYFLLPPYGSWALSEPGKVARLVLAATTFAALVLVGDSLRRVRRANTRLARAVERLDTIIMSIADGVMITDREGTLVQTNEAMQRIHGGADVPRTPTARQAAWQPRQTDGTPLTPAADPLARALAGDVVTRAEVIVRNAAGEDRQLSVSGAPLRRQDGAIDGAVVVSRDISELRRLQQAKDDFLSVASHELKTPITALRGYIQLLRQRFTRMGMTDERSLRYLTTIEGQMQRVTGLVETLLDVSRLDAGRLRLHPVPFDLVVLVREVADELGGLSERHPIAVEAMSRIEGTWDRDRIEQVLVNLLSNAVRYTPDGGPIAVTVATMPPDGGPSTVAADPLPPGDDGHAGRADGWHGAGVALVRVRDVGVGLPADQLPLVFERFHQAHEASNYGGASKGIGLGLYISREIVEQHGGRIWVESDGPGRGAAFTFTLPLAPTYAESAAVGRGA